MLSIARAPGQWVAQPDGYPIVQLGIVYKGVKNLESSHNPSY